MAPKRKRTRASEKASSKRSSRASQEEDETPPLALLSSHLYDLAKSKPACQQVLAAIEEPPTNPESSDAYHVLMAIGLVDKSVRWLLGGGKADNRDTVAVAGALWLAHALVSVLVGAEKSKLERCGGVESMRNILGQAIIGVTCACTLGLEHLLSETPPADSETKRASVLRQALWKGEHALEMAMNLTATPKKQQEFGGAALMDELREDARVGVSDSNDGLMAAFRALQVVVWTQDDESFWNVLREPTADQQPPAKKASSRRTKTSAAAALQTKLADNFKATPSALENMDGRVSIRRWASIAMVWLMEGQVRLTKSVLALLEHHEEWLSTVFGGRDSEMAPSTKKSPRKKPGSKKVAPSSTAVKGGVSGNVAMVTFSCRLLDLCLGAGAASAGARLPSGGFDTYVAAMSSAKKSAKKPPPPTKPDTRNLAVVTLSRLLELHHECFETARVISHKDDVDAAMKSCPFVAPTVNAVCRGASTSGSSELILYALSSSMMLRQSVVDVELVRTMVRHLKSIVPRENPIEWNERVSALHEWENPELPKTKARQTKARSAKTSTGEDDSGYGGLWLPPTAKDLQERQFHLYLRAVKVKDENPVAALFEKMLEIVGHCLSQPEVAPPAKLGGKRRRGGATKQPERKCPSPARVGLAIDILNLLREWLVVGNQQHRYLRDYLENSHLQTIAELGVELEKSILADPKSTDDELGSGVQMRSLWNTFINLCFTLARGSTIILSGEAKIPFLGPPEGRMSLFQSIGKSPVYSAHSWMSWPLHLSPSHHALITSNLAFEEAGQNSEAERYIVDSMLASIGAALKDVTRLTNDEWYRLDSNRKVAEQPPLSLKDGRLLLLANSRLPAEAQLTTCLAFIETLCEFVTNLSPAAKKTVAENAEVSGFVARSITVVATMINLVEMGTPLRDALFSQVRSMTYPMPHAEQTTELADEQGSIMWYKRESNFMGLFGDWESPVIPNVGDVRRKRTIGDVGKTNMKKLIESSLKLGFHSAKKDRCHLLYAAWNISGRQCTWDSDALVLSTSREGEIAEEHACSPQLLVELRHDICNIFRFVNPSSQDMNDSLVAASVQASFREKNSSAASISNILTAAISKAARIVDVLAESLNSSSKMDAALDVITWATLESVSVFLSFCISMHTDPATSFFGSNRRSRSRRTHSGEDAEIIASILSEEEESDGEYGYTGENDEEKITAIMRLHDACNVLGSAPVYPDYLDSSVRWRPSITAEVASTNASIALESLWKISDISLQRYMSACEGVAGESPDDAALALQICLLSQEDSNGIEMWSGEDAKVSSFVAAVAKVSGCSEEAVRLLLDTAECNNTQSAREAWSPNLSQRIIGRIQDRAVAVEGIEVLEAEHRAGGEWELMISESLLGACMDIRVVGTQSPFQKTSLSIAERWRTVFESSISHMTPAAALLEYSVFNEGKAPHPLGRRERKLSEITDASDTQAPVEKKREPRLSLPESAKDTVVKVLSVLPLISIANRNDDRLKQACKAVSACLLESSSSYSDLVSVTKTRRALDILLECMRRNVEEDAVAVLAKGLLSCLRSALRPPGSSDEVLPSSIYQCLNNEKSPRLDYFGVSTTVNDVQQAMSTNLREPFQSTKETPLPMELMDMLCSISADESEMRRSLAKLLLSLAETDSLLPGGNGNIVDAFATAIAKFDRKSLSCWLDKVFSQPDMTLDVTEFEGWEIAGLLTFVASSSGFPKSKEHGSFLMDKIRDKVSSLKTATHPTWAKRLFHLLFVIATRMGKLPELGDKLLDSFLAEWGASEDETIDLCCMVELCKWLHDLDEGLRIGVSAESDVSEPNAGSSKSSEELDGSSSDRHQAPRACSFVLRNGFHAQHWYNCYTCGLVWDKGCCSLCLLRCHKGHDVAYSRHSSFFCDCGAEVATAAEDGRVVCKCITPLSLREAKSTFEADESLSFLTSSNRVRTQQRNLAGTVFDTKEMPFVVKLAKTLFREDAMSAVKSVLGPSERWTRSLLQLLNDVTQRYVHDTKVAAQCRSGEEGLLFQIQQRSGRLLQLETSPVSAFVPVRASRSGSLVAKMSADTTTERLKRALLSKHGIRRSVCAVDSRGRYIIAEPCSILFGTLLPTVNTRFVRDKETLCSRAQMNLLGSSSVKFNIVGLKLCRYNERHLVVWGLTEVVVCVLNRFGDGVQTELELAVDLDPSEYDSEPILSCDWVPGTQTGVVVSCGSFVKIYDISRDDSDKIHPSYCYSLANDATICDMALVPVDATNPNCRLPATCNVKMFLLLTSGRLHSISMSFRDKPNRAENANQSIESMSSCIALPTEGVRTFQGVEPFGPGSTSRNLGEGQSLDFLPRSRILLYKCETSCVLALTLDKNCNVNGSFEFLPHLLSADDFAESEGYICGPFTHWTEMGLCEGDRAFRTVCVGRSSRTNQPRALCVDFDGEKSTVSALSWISSSSLGMGINLCSSFDGVAAFSAPIMTVGKPIEMSYVCLLTSGGSVMVFGEDQERLSKSQSLIVRDTGVQDGGTSMRGQKEMLHRDETSLTEPSFPLTIFEKLTNMSERPEVLVGGEGVTDCNGRPGCTSLLGRNGMPFVSPSRDGFTITISLEPTEPELVLVGVRFLVGSNSADAIPSYVVIQGRPVKLTADLKRWYDCALTKEEIILAIRTGFVTLAVGRSSDPTVCPSLDSVEVYAIDRKKVEDYVPTRLERTDASGSRKETKQQSVLKSCTTALTALCSVGNFNLELNSAEAGTLKALVEQSYFSGGEGLKGDALRLLDETMPNMEKRQQFLDEATISGVSKYSRAVAEDLHQEAGDEAHCDQNDEKWNRTLPSLLECANASYSIAKERPQSYVTCSEKLSDSLACTMVDLLTDAADDGLDCAKLADCVVQLVLVEIGIKESSSSGGSTSSFASFRHLGMLLETPDQSFGESCCEAIARFLDEPGRLQMAATTGEQPIAFCCDSCGLFPITDCRYTLPDGAHDIDLCTKCFELGRASAENQGSDSTSPVIINGKTVGEGLLTCSQIKEMHAVQIADGRAIAEQVEQLRLADGPADKGDSNLREAIRLGRTEVTSKLNFTSLSDSVFQEMLGVLSKKLCRIEDASSISQVNSLLTLMLRLVDGTLDEETRIERGKKLGTSLLSRVSRILESLTMRADPKSNTERLVLTNCLRSLSRLIHDDQSPPPQIAEKTVAIHEAPPEKNKDKTDPRFVCEEHGVPAVRRRISSGKNKNRRFYVCGMERKKRCKYFKWADEVDSEAKAHAVVRDQEAAASPSRFSIELRNALWQAMEGGPGSATSLVDRICHLLEDDIGSYEKQSDSVVPTEVTSSGQGRNTSASSSRELPSLYERQHAATEFRDGVFCSREKLNGFDREGYFCDARNDEISTTFALLDNGEVGNGLVERTIEAVLDLIGIVASPMTKDRPGSDHKTELKWFSLLCEIISMRISATSTRFRLQAKKALRRLCGDRRALYYSVRDHYVFGFQFRKLVGFASVALDAGLCVREKARVCGPGWTGETVSWQTASAGELLGVGDIISEDSLTLQVTRNVEGILNELADATKVRQGNWRHFCGLSALPNSVRAAPGTDMSPPSGKTVEAMTQVPPIVTLFWLACCLRGANQTKAFKLIDIALSEGVDPPPLSPLVNDGASSDGGNWCDSEPDPTPTNPLALALSESPPLKVLLESKKYALTSDQLLCFVVLFVLRNRFMDCRKVASQVAIKLCKGLSHSMFASLLPRLIEGPLDEICTLGSCSLQYLHFLQAILKSRDTSDARIDIAKIAQKIMEAFAIQMHSLRNNVVGRVDSVQTIEVSGQGKDQTKKRYDLSKCSHCHRIKASSFKLVQPGLTQGRSSRLRSSASGDTSQNQSAKKDLPSWLPEQVRPFVRGRLEASTEASVSDEFSMYVQLKCRLVISEIHLNINDPRSRFVKTIVVHFSPRQVADVSELKTDHYAENWQKCATLSLNRGGTRITWTLEVPVVAANLRFEYKEFYERPGGSRGADGKMIVHCPRCTRVVNNVHGVCGNCGESAYQCRKCRHINYDREDAFLCVECGYCSSGGFSFDLTAGTASNVVAITNDESFERARRTMEVANTLHSRFTTALKTRLRSAQSKKRGRSEEDEFSEYSPAMKRALLGELPLMEMGDNSEPRASSAARREESASESRAQSVTSSAANRARSFIRLARSLRNDGSSDNSRSARRDLLIREAFLGSGIREVSLEDLEVDSDEFSSLLQISDSSSRDLTDPLSRLMASLRGSRGDSRESSSNDRGNQRRSNRGESNNETSSSDVADKSEKTLVDECQKLYHLMRESEREAYEFRLRIDAWNRLERDALTDICDSQYSRPFEPCTCSKCSGPVTQQLLVLVTRLFQDNHNIFKMEQAITEDFIQALFLEPSNAPKDLISTKRTAIATVAQKSIQGGRLIYRELRARLRATHGADVMCTTVLGKLMEAGDFPICGTFAELAMETMEGR